MRQEPIICESTMASSRDSYPLESFIAAQWLSGTPLSLLTTSAISHGIISTYTNIFLMGRRTLREPTSARKNVVIVPPIPLPSAAFLPRLFHGASPSSFPSSLGCDKQESLQASCSTLPILSCRQIPVRDPPPETRIYQTSQPLQGVPFHIAVI